MLCVLFCEGGESTQQKHHTEVWGVYNIYGERERESSSLSLSFSLSLSLSLCVVGTQNNADDIYCLILILMIDCSQKENEHTTA